MPLNKFNKRRKAQPIDLKFMTGSKHWWESTTIQSILANALVLALAAIKLEASGEETAAIVTAIIGIIGTVGGIVGRKKAVKTIK